MRKWRCTFQTALHALRRNILRSTLTTLGIIIGVAAVIAMVEIGSGSSAAIRSTIESMGANNILIMPGTAASGGVSFGSGSVMTLTPNDCEAILRECPSVRDVAPIVRVRTQVVYGSRNWVPQFVYGSTLAFLKVRDWATLAEGEPFTERDIRNGNRTCLIGQTLVRELFNNESPLGKSVRVKNVSFRVVGVLAAKGASMMGMDQDDILLAPWTAIKYRVSGTSSAANAGVPSSLYTVPAVNSLNQLYPNTVPALYPVESAAQRANNPLPVQFVNVDLIVASVRGQAGMPVAIREIGALLHQRHRLAPGEPDDFTLRDMTEVTRVLASTMTIMTNLLLCVALISLAVGGVGIMNIMLVSVTERTREIGLRMAVGARARDILRQFLVEAVFLCLAGGALGILLGRLVSHLVSVILHWPTALSIPAMVAAVVVSGGVGILFGFYPAWKASRLDPIEALRYE